MKRKIRITLITVLLGGLAFIPVFDDKHAIAHAINAGAKRISHSSAMQVTSQSEAKVIRISAKKFEFSPSTITLKKGEPVVLELSSEDRTHGFNLKDFEIRADVKPSEATRINFTPGKTGSFTFSCDVFCGGGHADMKGTLVVTD
jgi:cytochrome c oxidase subunit II